MKQCDGNKSVYDLEICRDINLLKKASNIVIYGAGWKGVDVFFKLKKFRKNVSFFCDMEAGKWGHHIENVKIISPFEIKYMQSDSNESIYLIACVEQPQDVLNLFKYMRAENVRIITYWGIKMALYLNRDILFGEGSKEMEVSKIESIRRRNRFFDLGLSFMHVMLTSLENAIWVLQLGKTASSTLVKRLEEKKISYIKLHSLEYPQHILGEGFREIWEEGIAEWKKRPLKIITAVREPMSRDYSAFWQAFSKDNEMAMEMPILDKDFQKTYDRYINMIQKGSRYMRDILGMSMIFPLGDQFEWFDEQIKRYLDIDVFEYPFDRRKGYSIIRKGNIELLLYKVEKMEGILDVISSFVGVTGLSELNENIGDKKWYGPASSQFRRELKISKQYVEYYYCENPKMDHFYTLEEKEAFLEKWKDNIV